MLGVAAKIYPFQGSIWGELVAEGGGGIEKWPIFDVEASENFGKLPFFHEKRLFFMILVHFWR